MTGSRTSSASTRTQIHKYANTNTKTQKKKYKNRDIKKPVGLRQLHASTKKSIPSFFEGHARHYYPRLSESREPKKTELLGQDRAEDKTEDKSCQGQKRTEG